MSTNENIAPAPQSLPTHPSAVTPEMLAPSALPTLPVAEPVAAAQAPDFAPDVHEDSELDDEPQAAAEALQDSTSSGQPLQKVWRAKNFTPHPKGGARVALKDFDPRKENIFLPSTNQKGSDEIMELLEPTLKVEEDRKGATEYVASLVMGDRAQPVENFNTRIANREDGHWVQELRHNGKNLGPGSPPVSTSSGNLTPEAARRLFRSNFKLGTLFQVPLYHSGFWITLRAPGESELIELIQQIAMEKVVVGRQTYGRLYSNTTVFTSRHLMNFIIDKLMYQTTLALPEGANILEHIALPDLQVLIWGMACAYYSTGFQYSRFCTADHTVCRFEVKEKLNPTRMFWFDSSRLTTDQLDHMSEKKPKGHTLDAVKKYRDEFHVGRNKIVSIDRAQIELTLPSVAAYLDSGVKWLMSIENTYGAAIKMDVAGRQEYLKTQVQATAMREYAHCVAKMITPMDDEKVFEEDRVEVIGKILDDLSAQDDVREKFIEQVRVFLEDATMAFVAIETYTCPQCGKKQRPQEEGFPHDELLPIDAMTTFFRLAYQRVDLVQSRDLRVDNE